MDVSDVRIAIPTYNRPELIQRSTLKMIEDSGIPCERVDIWISGQSQVALYDKLPSKWRRRFFVGEKGLVKNRVRAEETHYVDGQRILWVNDDVFKIRKTNGPGKPWTICNLDDVIRDGFSAISGTNSHLWGIYQTDNKLWSSNGREVFHGLCYVVGCFYGIIHRRDRSLYPVFGDAKEDYERALRFFSRDGSITRLNRFHPKTIYYNSPEIFTKLPQIESNVAWIEATWPHLVKRNSKKGSPWPEINLRNRAAQPSP
jgi:hypothetical protein